VTGPRVRGPADTDWDDPARGDYRLLAQHLRSVHRRDELRRATRKRPHEIQPCDHSIYPQRSQPRAAKPTGPFAMSAFGRSLKLPSYLMGRQAAKPTRTLSSSSEVSLALSSSAPGSPADVVRSGATTPVRDAFPGFDGADGIAGIGVTPSGGDATGATATSAVAGDVHRAKGEVAAFPSYSPRLASSRCGYYTMDYAFGPFALWKPSDPFPSRP